MAAKGELHEVAHGRRRDGGPGEGQGDRPWFERPMRFANLCMVEDDPGNFDPQEWIDYFEEMQADAACLSAGGYVAYYPTKILYHHRSRWLEDRDPFGELVAGCRKLGMIVMARIDTHAVHRELAEAHPDWIVVDEHGSKRRHWEMEDAWLTCSHGPFSFQYVSNIIREIVSEYGVDGVFCNRWNGLPIDSVERPPVCYCEHCAEQFRAGHGMELPQAGSNGEHWALYKAWKQQRLFALWDQWNVVVQAVRPQSRFIPNMGPPLMKLLDLKEIGARADILFCDRQGRHGAMAPWMIGRSGKEFRAILGSKPIGAGYSVSPETPYRWKDGVHNLEETRVWAADGIANGLLLSFGKFAGQLHDRRWMPTISDIFKWHARNEPYLRNVRPLAKVALVHSLQTNWHYGKDELESKVESHMNGMYHALIEARIPFEFVNDQLMEPEELDRFKLIILSNTAALSDRQCEQLRAYAARGGSLLATYESSLYDELGRQRTDFGLADLFGVSYRERQSGVKQMTNAYLRLEGNESGAGRHPVLAGFDGASRIVHGTGRLHVEPTRKPHAAPLTLIPPHPSLPMEELYMRVPRTDIAELFLQEQGESRIVYIPWDIDRTYWEYTLKDHRTLLHNALRWAFGGEQDVQVAGPGVLDVTVWEQQASMTVHMVNLSNPNMMRGAVTDIVPVGLQKVRVRLPAGKRLERIRLLVSDTIVPFVRNDDWVEFDVPEVEVHEVAAIEWGKG